MANISDLGAVLRLPFELLSKGLNFIMHNLISILILVGAAWLVYWLYSSGAIQRISDEIVRRRKLIKSTKEVKNV